MKYTKTEKIGMAIEAIGLALAVPSVADINQALFIVALVICGVGRAIKEYGRPA